MNNKVILNITTILLIMVIINSKYLRQSDDTEKETIFKFLKFINQFNKHYETSEEFNDRYQIFKENLSRVKDHNTFTKFMDIRPTEFSNNYGFTSQGKEQDIKDLNPYSPTTQGELPKNLDWTEKGVVTRVKAQEDCRSCWAFSTTGNLEAQYAIKNKELIEFSEQQLVDCVKTNFRCYGGSMNNAFKYLLDNKIELELETEYPYEAHNGECRYKKNKGLYKIKEINYIKESEDDLLSALFEIGPISVVINANSFQFYKGGIISYEDCGFSYGNHGVLLVGYGEEEGKKFWKLKNSWGPDWGEEGYVRIERGNASGKVACGITQQASTAILE